MSTPLHLVARETPQPEYDQTVETLQASVAMYRALVEQLPAIIYTTSFGEADTTFYVSPQIERILGFPQDEWTEGPRLWLKHLHPQDRMRVLSELADSHASGDPFVCEYRLVARDGRTLWFHDEATVVRDNAGSPICLQGVLLDVTERKRAEETLRQRSRELELLNRAAQAFSSSLDLEDILRTVLEEVRHLLGAAIASIWLVDPETDELVCQQAARAMGEDLRGWRLVPGEGIAGWVVQHNESAIVPDALVDERYVRVPGADQRIGLDLRSILTVPMRVKEKVIGVVQVLDTDVDRFGTTDLTLLESLTASAASAVENARLYQEANRLRAFNENIVQSMEEGILLEDVSGIITFVNHKAEDLLGYTAEELMGQHWEAIVPAEHLDRVGQETARRVQGIASRYEADLSTKQGQQIPVLVSARPLYDEGMFSGVLSVFTDITDLKQAEEALKEERANLARRVAERTAELSMANAELARAARLKDEFLAAMSHELRTPLNAVLGLSETLQEEVYGPINERQRRSLRSIEESGRHLLELINEILDIAKIEAGKLDLQVDPVSVEAVCQSSLTLVKQMAHKKRLRVSSTFDSQVTVIQADARRLKQTLVNLLSNAVKFTPEGGSIGLEVVSDEEREAVHLTVWDTGIGISEDDIERLFQPFVQLDSSLSRRHSGTGLGLALVRRLTELHGGGVSLESQVGVGSRFTVSLPWRRSFSGSGFHPEPVTSLVQQDRPEQAEDLAFPPSGHGSETPPPLILLADDHEANIATVLDYLQAKGYRLTVARDGMEAIQRAREEQPDLILMDVQMPEMDGLEATRRIRADAASNVASVPIIALTALAMPGDQERCLEAGANAYLSKPVGLKHLVSEVEKHLSRA